MGKMDIDATPVVVGGETFEISSRSVQGPLVEITSCVGGDVATGWGVICRRTDRKNTENTHQNAFLHPVPLWIALMCTNYE